MTKKLKNILNWFSDAVNIVKQIRTDSKYRKEFTETILRECADPKSAFSKMGLKVGEDEESLIQVTAVPEEVQTLGQDYLIQDKLNEATFFTTKVLKEETGLNDYISLPEYFHIEDPSNTRTVSLTYLAIWHFNPMIDDSLKKKVLGTIYGVGTAIAGGLGYLSFVLLF